MHVINDCKPRKAIKALNTQPMLNRIWSSRAEEPSQKVIKFPIAGHEGKPVSLATVSNRQAKSKWPLSKD